MINDLLGKLVADKYRIESLIRESESGDLFRGVHEVMDKPVTLKILSPALAIDARWVKRFIDEARSVSAVSHPNILNITDFGTDAKSVTYAVFEAVNGRTLREIQAAEPAMDEARATEIARKIAFAVSAAHAKSMLHGAINPANVFVDNDETVKVYGFGSDPLHVARDSDPRYLAPEQCTSYPAADERSDVYSLGIVWYELLTGVVPYDGATAAEVLSKQSTEPPPPLSAFRRDLHPEVGPIVLTAIAADPDKRYQTLAAFAEDLDILSGRIEVPANAVVETEFVAKRSIWRTAFVVLGGISLIAAALIYATSVRKTDPTTQLQAEAGSLPVQPIGPATGAQEESLAKLPAMTDAEIMATSTMEQPPGTLPGGDGYNAWANGVAPPAGAPLPNYVPPGGQVYTIDPNAGSQFMPPDGGVILVPVPANTNANTAVKPTPTPKTPPANVLVQPSPTPAATPKPMATPIKNIKPGTDPKKGKPTPAAKPTVSGKPKDSE